MSCPSVNKYFFLLSRCVRNSGGVLLYHSVTVLCSPSVVSGKVCCSWQLEECRDTNKQTKSPAGCDGGGGVSLCHYLSQLQGIRTQDFPRLPYKDITRIVDSLITLSTLYSSHQDNSTNNPPALSQAIFGRKEEKESFDSQEER